MRRLPFILVALAVLIIGMAGDQPSSVYDLRDGSRFWIDGTATTGAFSCEVDQVAGTAHLTATHVAGRVNVPVAAFDCGISRMNRDFFEALRGAEHPAIRFELDEARVIDPTGDTNTWVAVVATGTLHLAGQTRRIAVRADGQELGDGRVRVRGRLPLEMSDFGIEPPSAMLGLVRVNNRVVARFDLTASPR